MSHVIIPLVQEYVYEYVRLFAGTSYDKICEKINFLGVQLETGFWSLILVVCLPKYIKICQCAL